MGVELVENLTRASKDCPRSAAFDLGGGLVDGYRPVAVRRSARAWSVSGTTGDVESGFEAELTSGRSRLLCRFVTDRGTKSGRRIVDAQHCR